jgi:hypothetical protein
MENKKLHIALAIVVILILVVGIFSYIHFSKNAEDEGGTYSPKYEELPSTVDVKVGEYRFINVSEQDLISFYYKDFIDDIRNNPKRAWERLTDKCKKDLFKNSYEEYEKYLKKYYSYSSMDKYSVKKFKYKQSSVTSKIEFVDSLNILYEIEEYSTWNYKVSIIANI